MSSIGVTIDPITRPPLDESLYGLPNDAAALDFFKGQTGIEDEDELKNHIFRVQAKAYDVYGYPCIRNFGFLKLKISRLPGYRAAFELLKKHKDPILLDLGCCFGNDVRKVVVDGWPITDVIASDLRQGFWDAGHELFKSTPQSFPAAFVAGDVFDPTFIQPAEPIYSAGPTSSRPSDLNSLTSLTPLQGHISVIHTSSFFHLFDEDGQLKVAHQVASLLSPEPGSLVFGSHIAKADDNIEVSDDTLGSDAHKDLKRLCHTPQTWTELWDGTVFKKGSVRVEASLRTTEIPKVYARSGTVQVMSWSVTRL